MTTADIINLLVPILLMAFIFYQSWAQGKEREEWARKLMAKTYYDYMLTPKAPTPRQIDKQLRDEVNEARQTAETYVPVDDMGSDQVDKLLKEPPKT